jgi:multiple sugar transport system ATP-binding protein
MTMADRIVILRSGELQQVGSPKEVYHKPENRFVADFIGSPSMNFVDVNLSEAGVLEAEGLSFELKETVNEMLSPGQSRYILGVRPEDITIDEDAPVNKSLSAIVDVVEIVGSDNFIYLDHAGEEFRVRVDSDIEPAAGDEVRLTFSDDSIHLFDVQTGEAIIHGVPQQPKMTSLD